MVWRTLEDGRRIKIEPKKPKPEPDKSSKRYQAQKEKEKIAFRKTTKKFDFQYGDYFGMGMTEDEIKKYKKLYDLEEKAYEKGLTESEYKEFKKLVMWIVRQNKGAGHNYYPQEGYFDEKDLKTIDPLSYMRMHYKDDEIMEVALDNWEGAYPSFVKKDELYYMQRESIIEDPTEAIENYDKEELLKIIKDMDKKRKVKEEIKLQRIKMKDPIEYLILVHGEDKIKEIALDDLEESKYYSFGAMGEGEYEEHKKWIESDPVDAIAHYPKETLLEKIEEIEKKKK